MASLVEISQNLLAIAQGDMEAFEQATTDFAESVGNAENAPTTAPAAVTVGTNESRSELIRSDR